MKYSFEVFMKEQRRAIWLSPNYSYTEQELKEKCYDDYLKYCQEHNLISD